MFCSPLPVIPVFGSLPRSGPIAGRAVVGNFDEGANSREKSFIISWFAVMATAPAWRRRSGAPGTETILIRTVAELLRTVFRANARRNVEGPSVE